MKKLYRILVIISMLCLPLNNVYSANTKSHDFEFSNSQFLSLAYASAGDLDFTDDFSFELWVKFETLPSIQNDNVIIISKYQVGKRHYDLRFRNTDILQLVVSSDGEATALAVYRGTETITSGWHFIAATYDISADEAKLTIDGTTDTPSNLGETLISPMDSQDVDFRIGSTEAGTVDFPDGLFDQIVIWDDVRTPAEIAAGYNSGNGKIYDGNEAGMVAYWQFEDDILDTTANDNDLTFNTSGGSEVYSSDVPFAGSTPAVETKRQEEVMWFN